MVTDSITELSAFGVALRTYRQRVGLSQEALAHICGLNRTYIGSIERGERNVSLLNIHVLAGALKITASELVGTAEEIRQKPIKGGDINGNMRQINSHTGKR
jgi:transcriptional regulator with XRE-family HTH domain